MLIAAKHKKDRKRKLIEDEITSIVLGPLAYMSVEDVWVLFQVWLPYKEELWRIPPPTGVKLDFWPNLKKGGRVEPDLKVRFFKHDKPVLIVVFEIKWNSPLSGEDELVKQWGALSGEEKEIAFHVYLVKNTSRGVSELKASLKMYNVKDWRERLSCIGWRSLIEILRFDRPKFGRAMNIWADSVLAFFTRYGLSVFTGFTWVGNTVVAAPWDEEIFWKPEPWFSGLDQKIEVTSGNLFWNS